MISSTPTVSVIIPAYRHAGFLNQAVDSISRQTFTDYEIIVVDDGSGDDVVRQYRLPESAHLIRLMENSGRAAVPRNEGFRVARGRYIAFLDMDDIWLPEKLEKQVAVLDTHPDIAVTICDCTFVDKALNPIQKQHPIPPIGPDLLKQLVTRCFIVSPSQTLIRREVLEGQGPFDPAITAAADWDLWLRLAQSARFYRDSTADLLYRKHPGQQTANRLRIRDAEIHVMEKTKEWIGQQRPDLLPIIRSALDRLYCKRAKLLMRQGADITSIIQSLRSAYRHNPYSLRALLGMIGLPFYSIKLSIRKGCERQLSNNESETSSPCAH